MRTAATLAPLAGGTAMLIKLTNTPVIELTNTTTSRQVERRDESLLSARATAPVLNLTVFVSDIGIEILFF